MEFEFNDFLEALAEQFDSAEVSQLTMDTRFKELDGYTSLVALLIITMIDEEYGITITGDNMVKAVTVSDLYHLVNSDK